MTFWRTVFVFLAGLVILFFAWTLYRYFMFRLESFSSVIMERRVEIAPSIPPLEEPSSSISKESVPVIPEVKPVVKPSSSSASPVIYPRVKTIPKILQVSIVYVDRVLKKMLPPDLSFNPPPSIKLGTSVPVQMRVKLSETLDHLRQLIEAEEPAEGLHLLVSDRMEAKLSGSNFSITPLTPESQGVTPESTTEWNWQITPLTEGEHSLHLTLSVLISVNEIPTLRTMKSFDHIIHVYVTRQQRFERFAQENEELLQTAALILFMGWLFIRINRVLTTRQKRKALLMKPPKKTKI